MTVLVLGATGKTGRRVVERLERRSVRVRLSPANEPRPESLDDPDEIQVMTKVRLNQDARPEK